MHIPPRTKRFFVKTFHMEEGSITDTEIGRRHHPKLFGKYRNSIWSKFYKTRYLATPCHCHCEPKCTCCQSQPIDIKWKVVTSLWHYLCHYTSCCLNFMVKVRFYGKIDKRSLVCILLNKSQNIMPNCYMNPKSISILWGLSARIKGLYSFNTKLLGIIYYLFIA